MGIRTGYETIPPAFSATSKEVIEEREISDLGGTNSILVCGVRSVLPGDRELKTVVK